MEPKIAEHALNLITFEAEVAGGGSFWSGDNLLATLDMHKRPQLYGRLSIREGDRVFEMVCNAQGNVHTSLLKSDADQAGSAEWTEGVSAARLVYRGCDYTADSHGLYEGAAEDENSLVIRFDPPPQRHSRQRALHVAADIDLPLVAFYVFIAHHLSEAPSHNR